MWFDGTSAVKVLLKIALKVADCFHMRTELAIFKLQYDPALLDSLACQHTEHSAVGSVLSGNDLVGNSFFLKHCMNINVLACSLIALFFFLSLPPLFKRAQLF